MPKHCAAAATHGAAASSGVHVPCYVPWAISFLIPILVAAVNHMMVVLDLTFISWKFETAKAVLESGGLATGTFALVGLSALFASIAAVLVTMLAPTCAGSGIPEVLGFLNGNELPGVFSLRSSIIRIFAIVLAQSAGFPIGREGPMIAIGGSIGFGVAHVMLRPYEQCSEKVTSEIDGSTGETYLTRSSLIATQERFASARRIGCALGSAAGIATAFNSPIGGILYMCEEAAVSGFMPKFHMFMCTVIGSFAGRAFLQVTSMDVHRLVIYDDSYLNQGQSWNWSDMLVIVPLAALIGAAGGLNANACARGWQCRTSIAKRLIKRQPCAKIVECLLWCSLCACLFSIVPALLACSDDDLGHAKEPDAVEGHRRLGSSLNLVRHTCPEGQHSQAATLLLQGAEAAVKHVYSHVSINLCPGQLVAAFITYGIMAVGMPGLCVPMGLFIPNMLLGGLAGRLVGELATSLFKSFGIVSMPAGVYAVVGSAAMLAGFTHMTVGIVALLIEAIHDLSLMMPLMLVVSIARYTATFVAHHGYDEQIIIRKGVPFLDTEIPHEVEFSRLTAGDVCYMPPTGVVLPKRARVRMIKHALHHNETDFFPIVSEDGHCVGLTNRGRLKAVLKAVNDASPRKTYSADSYASPTKSYSADDRPNDRPSLQSLSSEDLTTSKTTVSDSCSPKPHGAQPQITKGGRRISDGRLLGDQEAERKMKDVILNIFANPQKRNVIDADQEYDDNLLPIERVMDLAPYMISETMPIQRFYALFNDISVNVLCVLSHRGTFLGIITRRGLIDVVSRLHHAHSNVACAGNAIQYLTGPQREPDLEDPPNPPACTGPEQQDFHSIEGAQIDLDFKSPPIVGGIATPSDISSPCITDDDTGDDESLYAPKFPLGHTFPGMSRRKLKNNSNSTYASSYSTRSGTTVTAASSSNCAANAVADMLGPTELRAQLAAAWARLAESEQEQASLLQKLRNSEQHRVELLQQMGGTLQANGGEPNKEYEQAMQADQQEEEPDEAQDDEEHDDQEENHEEHQEENQKDGEYHMKEDLE